MQTVSEEFEHDLMSKLKIQDEENHHEEVEQEDENEEEEEEFTFMFMNPDGSPISADEAFDNGQIRPVFPVFNQDLLFADGDDFATGLRLPIKKVFVQQQDNSPSSTAAEASESELVAPEGPYCEWTPKATAKSNSTGFSKLWRFKDPKLRSNSDGKDTFVFLNPPPAKAEKASSGEARKVVVKKVKGKMTPSSAHEKLYMMNRAKKESDKRKSYLPYKQDLFGFFANANGLTRNLHPY